MRAGRVKRRARDHSGELIGTRNENPILDMRMYQVEYQDGAVAEYAANVIAENMYSQCDPECDPDGNQRQLMRAIVDHQSNDRAVKFTDRFIMVK